MNVAGVIQISKGGLWLTIEYERVYLQAYEAVSAVRSNLNTYIDWYSRERKRSSIEDRNRSRPDRRCCPSWPWLPRMKIPVRPELPTASDGSSHGDHRSSG